MASKIGIGVLRQRDLLPVFNDALRRLERENPTAAHVIRSYVAALRTECAGHREEAVRYLEQLEHGGDA